MKKYLLFSAGLVCLSLLFVSTLISQKSAPVQSEHIVWIDLEKANMLAQQNAKPILIDVYTDWCKWCKVMDETTFEDPEIIKYVNQHFYPVKLNAEHRSKIEFKGKTYEYVQKGANMIIGELLGNRPSYPSLVLMDEKLESKQVLKGYQKEAQLLPQLLQYKKELLLTSN